ncbi:hypothetical protein GCM10020219_046790 [Nonomuraea dietziae]
MPVGPAPPRRGIDRGARARPRAPPPRARRAHRRPAPGGGALPDRLKVAEALRLFAAFYRRPDDWRQVMERWGLAPLARKAYGDLSGGQRQRLQIALALVGSPELVILDELTTGLDPVARRETWALVGELKAAGVTVVLVSHFMDEAEALCDRIAVFARGRIISLGTAAELMTATGTNSLDEAYLELVR